MRLPNGLSEEEHAEMQSRKKERMQKYHEKEILKTRLRRIFWLGIAGFVLLIDQLSKWYVLEQVMRPARYSVEGPNFFEWYLRKPIGFPFSQIEITSYFNFCLLYTSDAADE